MCQSVSVFLLYSIPRVDRLTRAACEFGFGSPPLNGLSHCQYSTSPAFSSPAQCWLAAVQTVQVHHLHSSKSVKSVIPHLPQSLVVVVAAWPTPT